MRFLHNPVSWGIGALATVTALALVAALLYVSPPGQQVVYFDTNDAASIRPGDQVRIAGINVGKVKNLELQADHVRVRADIDGSAFVGDKSQIEVRMLTVVGGYYVNLISLGDQPLDGNVIPMEHATMPYSLIRTLTDATEISDKVQAPPVNQVLNEMQHGLQGTNLETLTAVLDAGNSLMSMVERQRGQVTQVLDMSDEYIESLKNYREELRQIVAKISILEQTLSLYSEGFGGALFGLGKVLQGLRPVGIFYDNHRDEFLKKVRDWQAKGRLFVERNGMLVRNLHRLQDKIQRVLNTQNSQTPEFLATDLCIPMPGSPC